METAAEEKLRRHHKKIEATTSVGHQLRSNPIDQLKSGQLTSDGIISLQQTVGNQAVMNLLKDNKSQSPIQREPADKPAVQVRSPVFESLLNQGSMLHGAISGRPLTSTEISLAKPVFGNSIDFSQVRIIRTSISAGTTVGNVIRMHEKFDVSDTRDAQTLIHELTHVWQYQHYGTRYISVSLQSQISATIKKGSRNHAYDYTVDASKKFFDFMPEQQGFIVENYHAMKRDLALLAEGKQKYYYSNHMGADGFPNRLNAKQRKAEIDAELPIHETYVTQMRQAIPLTQSQLLLKDAQDSMPKPLNPLGDALDRDKQLTPVKPFLKFEF